MGSDDIASSAEGLIIVNLGIVQLWGSLTELLLSLEGLMVLLVVLELLERHLAEVAHPRARGLEVRVGGDGNGVDVELAHRVSGWLDLEW